MIENKKEFMLGFVMMVAFLIVLGGFFSPIFNGHNGMEYLDSLYNSISKDSAYYIPKSKDDATTMLNKIVSVQFSAGDAAQADQIVEQLKKCGADASADDKNVTMNGDLGAVLLASLDDAELLYRNDGAALSAKYGFNERQVVFNWYSAFKGAVKDLNKQEKFEESKVINGVLGKSIETSYNYYKIIPKKIGTCWWIVVGSLLFYVIYTMWYGYAILFMFEGWGMKFGH
jgi:hypothetical protein